MCVWGRGLRKGKIRGREGNLRGRNGPLKIGKKVQIPINEKIAGLEKQKRRDKCKACDKKALKT